MAMFLAELETGNSPAATSAVDSTGSTHNRVSSNHSSSRTWHEVRQEAGTICAYTECDRGNNCKWYDGVKVFCNQEHASIALLTVESESQLEFLLSAIRYSTKPSQVPYVCDLVRSMIDTDGYSRAKSHLR